MDLYRNEGLLGEPPRSEVPRLSARSALWCLPGEGPESGPQDNLKLFGGVARALKYRACQQDQSFPICGGGRELAPGPSGVV